MCHAVHFISKIIESGYLFTFSGLYVYRRMFLFVCSFVCLLSIFADTQIVDQKLYCRCASQESKMDYFKSRNMFFILLNV